MRVLVTGASGFVGSHLVPALAQTHEVFATMRPGAAGRRQDGQRSLLLDFTDSDPFANLPREMDAIIHLAQAPSQFPENANEMFAVNARSTLGLAEYARRAGVKTFIYASTGNVYEHSEMPRIESDPCRPHGFYELTKWTSEQILGLYASWFNMCILRLFTPYGPGQNKRMLTKIADAVQAQETVILHRDGRPFVTPIFIEDVVAVFVRSLEWGGNSVFNVSGNETISVRQIAEHAAAFYGLEPVFTEQPDSPQTWNLIGVNEALRSRLGAYEFTPFRDGYNAYLASRG